MSVYKDQLKKHLATVDIDVDSVLSIGNQEDDRKYFKSFKCKSFKTLDFDRALKPDIVHDMNNPYVFPTTEDPDDHTDRGSFDLILAIELWEYIWDPMTAHTNIAQLLREGGFYIGSYPFVYPIHNPAENDYLRYTPMAIDQYTRLSGLKIERQIFRRAGNGHLIEFYDGDGLRASKDWANHDITGTIIHARKVSNSY